MSVESPAAVLVDPNNPTKIAAISDATLTGTEAGLVVRSLPGIAGQQTMAASQPVVVAVNQTAIPVSAASLPLPAGASTSAKQPALGTAGTPSVDVLTIQGRSGMTPVAVSGSVSTGGLTDAELRASNVPTVNDSVVKFGYEVTTEYATLIQGVVEKTVPEYGDKTTQILTITSKGGLRVDGSEYIQPVAVASVPNPKATFAACILDLPVAAAATDVFSITGSSLRTQRIRRVIISGYQTTAGLISIALVKRSTANSGGTSTNPSKVAQDSSSISSTATINAYTANPTTGALVGIVRARKMFLGSLVVPGDTIICDFSSVNDEAVVLRGTSQVLAVNLAGATISGGTLSIALEYTEE